MSGNYSSSFVVKLRRARSFVLAVFVLLAVLAVPAYANPRRLKSNVMIVKPQYHEKTRQMFRSLSRTLSRAADDEDRSPNLRKVLQMLADTYQQLAESPGHGSGWLWIPPKSDVAFVITNKHVVAEAGSVTLEFDTEKHPVLQNNHVIYVDPRHDLAVIEVAKRELPDDAVGFELADGPLVDAGEVWAAGFPGTETSRGRVPVYSLTKGVVSNAQFEGPEGAAISHTATVDPGNSGGPLLVEVPSAKLKFRVAGMNTWKLNERTNANISIPASTIKKVLVSAMESRQIARDHDRLTEALRRAATRLADELGSSLPDRQHLNGMIAYSFVNERPGVIEYLLKKLLSGKMSEDELQSFLDSPVEYARMTWGEVFFSMFSTGASRVGGVKLQSITGEESIATDVKVRTVYQIAGRRQEVVWIWENGAWRITNASLENALRAGEAPAQEDADEEGGEREDAEPRPQPEPREQRPPAAEGEGPRAEPARPKDAAAKPRTATAAPKAAGAAQPTKQ